MSARIRTAVLLFTFLALAVGVGAGVAAQPAPGAASTTAVLSAAPTAPAELHRIDAIPADQPLEPGAEDDAFLAALLGPASDTFPNHAEALVETGHRVCEGLAAGVPTEGMRDELMTVEGWTVEDALALLAASVEVYCPSFGA